jgi:MerR family mercuric resistance operon transcriptional regulator
MLDQMTIGQLAAAAEVNVETVRYYQRRNLLALPDRAAGGIGRYPAAALTRLRFIRRAQSLGFTLADIQACSPWTAAGTAPRRVKSASTS